MPGIDGVPSPYSHLLSLRDREYIEAHLAHPDTDHEFWDVMLSGCKIRDYMLSLDCNQVVISAEGGISFENVNDRSEHAQD